MKPNNPPRWAEAFFDFYCTPRYREEIKGDLYELFDMRCEEKSPRTAKARFVWDVLRFCRWRYLRKFFDIPLMQQQLMVKNYLKVSVRTLKKQRLHSLINVGGLALGLAACVLILLYVQFERGYDRFHEKGDRLYLLSQWHFFGPDHHTDTTWLGERAPDHGLAVTLPLPISQAIKETVPGVEGAVATNVDEALFAWGTRKQQEEVMFVEEDFLSMFSFPVKYGSAEALSDPYQIAMTERKAREFFGNNPAVGQTLQVSIWNNQVDLTVGAVLEDPSGQSQLEFDFLVPMQHAPRYDFMSTYWEAKQSEVYVLLAPGASKASVAPALQNIQDLHFFEEEDYFRGLAGLDASQPAQGLQLIPISEVHV
ncbi:MAG: ABC transporter permease, partial [Bacteroidota bacterium]